MKSIIAWAAGNSPAVNTLMIAFLAIGAWCMLNLRREEFPEFELEIILITVPYPGASPEEVENGICQKIEEAVRSIDGIKKQTTVAKEGAGSVVLELEASGVDPRKVLSEVRSEVDRIPSFPDLAEDPEIQQITMRRAAIRIGIIGPDKTTPEAELELRAVAEQVRSELLQLKTVSQAEIQGGRQFQIDVEIPEETLRKYGLSLREVAQSIRQQNIELPAGSLKSRSQDVLLRGKDKRMTGHELRTVPLVTSTDGAVLTVGDLGVVKDEFADTTLISRINGKPGLVVAVNAAAREDLLKMTAESREYVEQKTLPPGYKFVIWGDRSVNVNDRIDLLRRNGLQGLILVFIVLTVFLELRLAFWVALGIPISILGACTVLYFLGQTMNMLSMFSFLMALGIVVDDAIVIGENIYAHRERGKGFMQAAIDGTYEVLPSVATSVTTTVFAFMPMLFVTGVMGKFFAVMPAAMIAMLIISLVESMFILPCHLAHRSQMPPPVKFVFGHLTMPLRILEWVTNKVNNASGYVLDNLRERIYAPTLRLALDNWVVTIGIALAMAIGSYGAVRAGITPFVFFPKLDGNQIQAQLIYPNGTPQRITAAATERAEQAFEEVATELEKETGKPIHLVMHRTVGMAGANGGPGGASEGVSAGSHVGIVSVELLPSKDRTITSQEILELWRAKAGDFPGIDTATFNEMSMGPGGKDLEFKLLADASQMKQLENAVEACKDKLSEFAGVYDVGDDSRPGKLEFQLKVKENARNLGVPLAELAQTVRASYYGEEVMRLQRGRHEVKLMVRYPTDQRQSLGGFEDIRIRGADGAERPLTEIADVAVERGYAEINRINQKRSITVYASVDNATGNARDITRELKEAFIPHLLENYPGIQVLWEGQAQQTEESFQSLLKGFAVALLGMFVLLTVEFRSYLQPLIILAIIPFGAIGAVWGHVAMGLPLTLFSVLGLVALTGVVVNDSIVLMDFINSHRDESPTVKDALVEAGKRRLRPVLLTSITTIAGLLPILTETSLQAQLVIPMATSLCFGLLLATLLVLYLVPTFYLVYSLVVLKPATEPEEEGPVLPPKPSMV